MDLDAPYLSQAEYDDAIASDNSQPVSSRKLSPNKVKGIGAGLVSAAKNR